MSELDKESYRYKYSIQQENKNAIEVKENTIAQLIGINSYGEIYEYMMLYDEYAEQECYLYYDEDDFCYREVYDNISERIDSLEGFIPIETGLVEKVVE